MGIFSLNAKGIDRLEIIQLIKLLDKKDLHDFGHRKNNRAKCSHVPIRRRERKSQKLLSAHGPLHCPAFRCGLGLGYEG